MDRSEVTLPALFDVGAAFDSVDHDILLKRISITFGIRDLPLIWLTFYLSDRSASVTFHSSRSSWRHTPVGLYPKDVFLGLFSIFCLLQILALFSHLVLSQVILMPMTFNPTNIAQHLGQLLQIRTMSQATDALNSWMSSNRLLLNPHKTQYI